MTTETNHKILLLSFVVFGVLFYSCKNNQTQLDNFESKLNLKDSLPNKRFSKSEIINSKFNTKFIFGTWTLSYNEPACSFQINEKCFSFCDYDGNGERLYKIIVDSIFLDNPYLIFKGKILQATGDTLIIHWQNNQIPETLLRWKD